MPPKRKLTTTLITRKAKAAFKKHGPDLSLHQFAQLSGLSVPIIQLRLGPWLRFKESLGLKPCPARPDRPTHDPDQILARLQELAAARPRISLPQFTAATGYSEKTIARHFNSWSSLKQLARLAPTTGGKLATHPGILLADFARVAQQLGRVPTEHDYARHGRFSVHTLTRRLERWSNLPTLLRTFLQILAKSHPTPQAQAEALQKLQDPTFQLPDS